MAAIISGIVSFLGSAFPAILSFVTGMLTYAAGQNAQEVVVNAGEQNAEAIAKAAHDASIQQSTVNPGGLLDDDGFKRPD